MRQQKSLVLFQSFTHTWQRKVSDNLCGCMNTYTCVHVCICVCVAVCLCLCLCVSVDFLTNFHTYVDHYLSVNKMHIHMCMKYVKCMFTGRAQSHIPINLLI